VSLMTTFVGRDLAAIASERSNQTRIAL
jgi:hypothetical protein